MVSSTYLKAKIVATQEAAEKSTRHTREGKIAITCPANKGVNLHSSRVKSLNPLPPLLREGER